MAIHPRSSAPSRLALALLATTLGIASASSADELSDEALDQLLARNPATDRPVDGIAELVPLLPETLRRNFTFVYASRSPFAKSITPDHPRVILFSDDASFIATFTGDPQQGGHDILETMRFDRASARWALRARVLPAAARAGADELGLQQTCARCHGEDARPIFDSYPLWPGFYGSVEDSFPSQLPSSRREHADYLHFLHGEAQTGVYRALRYIQGSPVTPYRDPLEFPIDQVRGEPDTLPYQPNTRLGMALTELNRKRIYRKLTAAAGFAEQAPAYLALLLGCDGARAPKDTEALRSAALAENVARLLRLGVDPTVARAHRFQMQELDQISNLSALDLVARRAGVDRSDWSMALEPASLSFYDGILSGQLGRSSYYLTEDLIFELLRDLAQREPRYARYFQVRPSFPALGYPFGNKLDLARAVKSCAILGRR